MTQRLIQLHGILKQLELAGAWYTAALVRDEINKLIKELICDKNE